MSARSLQRANRAEESAPLLHCISRDVSNLFPKRRNMQLQSCLPVAESISLQAHD